MSDKKNMTLLILAAGMGSRYGGIKQIDGFGPSGETIMDYSLFDAIRSGFTKIVFIVREEIKETVKEIFLPRLQGKVEVDFVVQALDTMVPAAYQNTERTKPWGTAHAMLCARNAIKEPFAVINADDFYGKGAFESIATFFRNDTKGEHTMVGYLLKNVLSENGSVSRGCGEQDDKGYLKSVVERSTVVKENGKIISKEKDGDVVMSPETPTSMNFWGFQPNVFPMIETMFEEFLKENSKNPKAEFFIPIIGNQMIKKGLGKVKIIGGGDIWFGVTYKEDKEEVSQKIKDLVAQGIYPPKLWA
jgi:NDP-sugar pyrophosphorylase family protein